MTHYTQLFFADSTLMKLSYKLSFLLYLAIYANGAEAKNIDIALVTEHFPPFQIVSQNKEISGFSTELMREAMQRSKYNYSLTAYPWTVAYNLALTKPNYCVFSMARIPSRENLFSWVGKVTNNNSAIVWRLKNKKNIEITQFEDLKKYTIAVKRNNAPHQALIKRGFKEGENLYVLENANALINVLYSRAEIDFIIVDDITIRYRAKLAGIDLNSLEPIYEISDFWSDFYLACHKKTDKKVISKLSLILDNIHKDGSFKKLLDKWKKKMIQVNLTPE